MAGIRLMDHGRKWSCFSGAQILLHTWEEGLAVDDEPLALNSYNIVVIQIREMVAVRKNCWETDEWKFWVMQR